MTINALYNDAHFYLNSKWATQEFQQEGTRSYLKEEAIYSWHHWARLSRYKGREVKTMMIGLLKCFKQGTRNIQAAIVGSSQSPVEGPDDEQKESSECMNWFLM